MQIKLQVLSAYSHILFYFFRKMFKSWQLFSRDHQLIKYFTEQRKSYFLLIY